MNGTVLTSHHISDYYSLRCIAYSRSFPRDFWVIMMIIMFSPARGPDYR